MLIGVGSIAKVARTREGIGGVAKLRREMTAADVAGLGSVFKNSDDKLQNIIKVCRQSWNGAYWCLVHTACGRGCLFEPHKVSMNPSKEVTWEPALVWVPTNRIETQSANFCYNILNRFFLHCIAQPVRSRWCSHGVSPGWWRPRSRPTQIAPKCRKFKAKLIHTTYKMHLKFVLLRFLS